MHHPLEGRTALVCGSTRGIGRACAEALADAGARVILVARDAAALSRIREELPTPVGQTHHEIPVDLSDFHAAGTMVRGHVAVHGPVHVLVNNSGGPPAGPLVDADADALRAAFAQHVLASQALVQAVVPGMREAQFGRIVNIISTSVVTPIKGLGVSNTIRGAVANWARTLAAELAGDGITVNSVLPGFTATGRLSTIIRGRAERGGTTPEAVEAQMEATVPAGRFGEPREVAAVVAFLASPGAAYVNGVNLPVDGGRLAAQ